MTQVSTRFPVLLAAFFAAASPAPAQVTAPQKASASASAPLPFDPAVTVGTLSNGMRYYIRENHKPERRAELRLVVNAGSVLEDEDQRGLAHMVEHMAFRGTKKFPNNQISSSLESVGMRYGPDINAFTSFDETVYEVTIPTDTAAIVDKGFQILSEWAHSLAFEPSQIAKERPVVIEEWRLGQGAENRMQNKWFPVLFEGSRYGQRIPIGLKSVLETYSPATLRRFYDTWYRPDLMAVVAVGDFNKNEIESLIRRYLGAIPPASNPKPRPIYPVPPRDSTLVSINSDKEATRSVIRLLYKQPKRFNTTEETYRQNLVEQLFGSMFNDRFSEITQKPNPPFINAFAAEGDLVRSAESFSLTAIVADNGIPRGLNALLTEGERVKRHGFLQAELDRAKKDLQRGTEQAYAERDKTNSGVSAREIKDVGITEWKLSNGVRVLLKPTDFNADQIAFTSYSPGGASLLPDASFLAASAADLIPMTSGVGKFTVIDLQKFLAGKE